MSILIVDDSKAARMILKRALNQAGYGSHKVQEASNGAEALDVIAASTPDLVLCDWNMPEMSGIELLEKINADGLKARLGFVTSEGTDDVRQRAQDAGALFFVSKPVTPEGLQEKLAPVLG